MYVTAIDKMDVMNLKESSKTYMVGIGWERKEEETYYFSSLIN